MRATGSVLIQDFVAQIAYCGDSKHKIHTFQVLQHLLKHFGLAKSLAGANTCVLIRSNILIFQFFLAILRLRLTCLLQRCNVRLVSFDASTACSLRIQVSSGK